MESTTSTSQPKGTPRPAPWSKYPFLSRYPPRTVMVRVATPTEWAISQKIYKDMSKPPTIEVASVTPGVVPVDRTGYPFFELYPPVKNFQSEVAPEAAKAEATSSSDRSGYPHFELYPKVDKIQVCEASSASAEETPRPCDRTGYPWFELYPSVKQEQKEEAVPAISKEVSSSIPDRSGYPYFELYPPVKKEQAEAAAPAPEIKSSQLADQPEYHPWFELCAEVGMTPEEVILRDVNARETKDRAEYSGNDLSDYNTPATTPASSPALPSSPRFGMYPAASQPGRAAYNFFDVYPITEVEAETPAPAREKRELVQDIPKRRSRIGGLTGTSGSPDFDEFAVFQPAYPFDAIYPRSRTDTEAADIFVGKRAGGRARSNRRSLCNILAAKRSRVATSCRNVWGKVVSALVRVG
ncbi:hypothetical protein BOTBODRAFT_172066 [Botryobasidium botryosum FD-172 SS1]|uniref:Uncharacterized protein n=1 Tax=Botryobasidium botryosum (strain FD-172 SS1) TaxID=930990 RepID=A0A067N0B8_BOTB1|nr:hypothetical protein BOTBODRAFT_172066 [Botryobasidium botryosum FD-172 SS1]